MSAAEKMIKEVAAITVDTTAKVYGSGGHSSSAFYFDCTAIGTVSDTWQVTLYWTAPSGAKVTIAQSATFTTTGLKAIVLQAPFTSANYAVPEPNEILFDNTSAGATQTLTGKVFAAYAG